MKLLVAGSRDATELEPIRAALDKLHSERPVTLVITGGAPGVDRGAEIWAIGKAIDCATYLAAWRVQGKAAGPIRNQRMIDEGKPDAAMLFPGGRGTADMRRRLENAGIPIFESGK